MLQQDNIDLDNDESGDVPVLRGVDNFLILSGVILDPLCPLSSKIEGSLAPVVESQTARACTKLVHHFRHALQMELVSHLF